MINMLKYFSMTGSATVLKRNRSPASLDAPRIVTIWNTYGPYHIARVRALQGAFQSPSLICFSHCATNHREYPFFNITQENAEVIVGKDEADSSFFEAFSSTLRLLRKHNPDLILACGYERPETVGAVAYAATHGKSCFLMMDNRYEDRVRKRSVELIKSIYLKLFDGYVYAGVAHRRYLIRLGLAIDKAVSGYDCVDNEAISSLASEVRKSMSQLAKSEAYVLSIGRLIEKKNWARLLAAYRQYVDSIGPKERPWKLVIAGDGPMRQEVEREISRLDLSESVRLTGQINTFEEIVRLHALAKLFVLASHHNEQWGLVVNEAMAASRPVLVSRECGCAENLVREGSNGFTFDPYSPQDLAQRMVWMHDHEDQLDKMGRSGYAIIAEYSPRRFAENVRALWEQRNAKTAAADAGSRIGVSKGKNL
jgi:glycosyltransferase involved in cell wall biosynthesis